MNLEAMLSIAQEAIELASRIVHDQRPSTVTEKADRDLVSDLDLAVERTVRAFLHDKAPHVGFLGEEDGLAAGTTDYLWVLDPVDGTSNYVHGLPLCAVSLALVQDRRAVLGIIDAPFLGTRYHARLGGGAFRDNTPVHAARTANLHDAMVAIGDYATGANADAKNRDRLALTAALAPRVHRIRMLGTAALDLAWVAEGKLDAMIMLSNKPWDTLAGALLAREAGATVLGRNGKPHSIDSTAAIAGATEQLATLLQSCIHGRGVRSAR